MLESAKQSMLWLLSVIIEPSPLAPPFSGSPYTRSVKDILILGLEWNLVLPNDLKAPADFVELVPIKSK